MIHSARFLVSSSDVDQCPKYSSAEYAFIGRSNVGKSSLINALTNNKKLAKTSGTPGKTKLINHFVINESWFLVDLPGYGYAKVSSATSATWRENLESYLCFRRSLKGVILLMDIRHPLRDSDKTMMTWLCSIDLPIHVLLTKSDKLSKSSRSRELTRVKRDLGDKISCQLFSSKSQEGLENLEQALAHWLN